MAPQLDHYRLLGRSGPRVSPLALCAMSFSTKQGWGSDDSESAKMIDHYIACGGNFIDTANFYGDSELVLGNLIQRAREKLVLSTK
jgi:aryl-alcohol dehydrogenase-like predicted oxidoreductase